MEPLSARSSPPELDTEAVGLCHRLAGFSFPWDITRALELALLKTFCLPSISGLLSRTGEFEQRPRKRYDDTGLMVAELLRHGPGSPTGTAVMARLNRIHGHYAIANADYLYVLSGFVAEPIRWLERYGWRSLSGPEQQALFRFWRHVGTRMGIAELPETLEQLLALNAQVEATVFAAAASNRRVADATLAMLLAGWPGPLRPPLARVLRLALSLRSRLANAWQRLRRPRTSRFYSERPTPSYGLRFQLEQLGPPALLETLNRPRWNGRQRRIGLTGGIASGKSSVGRLLAGRGLPLLDADVYAREVLAPGTAATRAVLARYGERVRALQPRDDPAGAGEPAGVDRSALGRIVFADATERHWLEQLVHPLVRQRFAAELERLAEAPVLVLIIPLLWEAGLEDLCSEVWLVDCEESQQLQRLMARDRLSDAEARARVAAQWPLARKRSLADRVIDNRGGPNELVAQVAAALDPWLRSGADSGAAAPP